MFLSLRRASNSTDDQNNKTTTYTMGRVTLPCFRLRNVRFRGEDGECMCGCAHVRGFTAAGRSRVCWGRDSTTVRRYNLARSPLNDSPATESRHTYPRPTLRTPKLSITTTLDTSNQMDKWAPNLKQLVAETI